MIRITNQEHVLKAGDFKVDGLHIKRFHFDLAPQSGAKEELTIEMVPFATMDDGSKIFDLNKVYKITKNDLQAYLNDPDTDPTIAQAVATAYYATEAAIAALMGDARYPENSGAQAVFEAPQ